MTRVTLRVAWSALVWTATIAADLGLIFFSCGPVLAQQSQDRSDASGTGQGGSHGADGNSATLNDKGLTLTGAEGDARLRLGGRLQLDFGTAEVHQSPFNAPYDDVFKTRRAWLESYLTLFNSFELAFQYDFSDMSKLGGKPINDAVVAYRGAEPFIVSLGNFKEPFSLDQLTSDNNTLFTERSLPDSFAPARNVGVAVGMHGDAWTAAAGLFGGNINTSVDNEGVAATARLTYAPIHDDTDVLHLGISGSYRSLDRQNPSVSFGPKPESSLFQTPLVTTKAIAEADDVSRVGLEAAYQTGPFRLQGEYIWTGIDRDAGLRSVVLDGGYIEAGYTINGHGRPYEMAPKYGTNYATFGAPKLEGSQRLSHGGAGVFEIGTRVSYLDLTDRAVRGGRETDVTVGLNWYPEPFVKVAADYVRAHASNSPAIQRNADADIFVARVQLYW